MEINHPSNFFEKLLQNPLTNSSGCDIIKPEKRRGPQNLRKATK
jgi:hypothetical protein